MIYQVIEYVVLAEYKNNLFAIIPLVVIENIIPINNLHNNDTWLARCYASTFVSEEILWWLKRLQYSNSLRSDLVQIKQFW